MRQRQKDDARRLAAIVDDIAAAMREVEDCGKVADELPGHATADPSCFGLAVCLDGGEMVTAGDADTAFKIQSISKVFSLTLALEAFGEDVWKRVGREPSGDPYNSIVDLERHKGIPRNPFINAGALVVVDILLGTAPDRPAPDFVGDRLVRLLDGEKVGVDEDALATEDSATFANRALANLAKSFGNLHHPVADVQRAYARQCAITLSCRQLARAGRYLMVEHVDREAGIGPDEARRSRRINALMLTCGQYDGSGDFAYRVGLPAKSGVSGGILAIVPNVASIAVWSPGLDGNGNSLLGTLALERLAEAMDWSVFGAVGE